MVLRVLYVICLYIRSSRGVGFLCWLVSCVLFFVFFFSSRRRHTRFDCDWSSDVCSSDLDPVMPGCLGLDAMWQLIGFYLTWLRLPGRGRALGAGEVKFTGEVGPDVKLVTYEINIKRVIKRKLNMAIGDARLLADGKEIYVANDLRVGLFLREGEGQGTAA